MTSSTEGRTLLVALETGLDAGDEVAEFVEFGGDGVGDVVVGGLLDLGGLISKSGVTAGGALGAEVVGDRADLIVGAGAHGAFYRGHADGQDADEILDDVR